MITKIKESADFIRSKVGELPKISVILGTGLGQVAEQMDKTAEIKYEDIPNFPVSTVEGHS